MTERSQDLERLLKQAGRGDRDALGCLLDEFRSKLRNMARRGLDADVAARVDESDVVQQTCLSAIKQIKEFDGADVAQFYAWLKVIHQNNIHNTIRRHKAAGKRAVGRESSGSDMLDSIATGSASPSGRVMQRERAAQLEAALEQLPARAAEALRLRYQENCSLADIARRMAASEAAVGGLLKRGMKLLREMYNVN